MNKNLPVCNKTLSWRWSEKKLFIHKEKLKGMRPIVDSSRPSTFDYFKNTSKRRNNNSKTLQETKQSSRSITKVKKIETARKIERSGSLNRHKRIKELTQIANENKEIYKRIRDQVPTYSIQQWEDNRKHVEKLLKNICEYPFRFGVKKTCSITYLCKIDINIGETRFLIQIYRGRAQLILIARCVMGKYKLKIDIRDAYKVMEGTEDYYKLCSRLSLDGKDLVLVSDPS